MHFGCPPDARWEDSQVGLQSGESVIAHRVRHRRLGILACSRLPTSFFYIMNDPFLYKTSRAISKLWEGTSLGQSQSRVLGLLEVPEGLRDTFPVLEQGEVQGRRVPQADGREGPPAVETM